MGTLHLIAVSTVFLLAYRNIQVKCQGEEGWTSSHNPDDDINQEHSTELSHNNQGWNNEGQAPTEHSNAEGSHFGEHDSSGVPNAVTESSNGYGMSENPSVPSNDKGWDQAEHKTESTASDGHDMEHNQPQQSTEATVEGEGHGWTNANDAQGNGRTESTGLNSPSDSHDEHGLNPQQTQGWGTDTTPEGDHHWNSTDQPHDHSSSDTEKNSTDDPQGYSSTESSDSQATMSNENHSGHSPGGTEHDYIVDNVTTPSVNGHEEHGEHHQQTVNWDTDTTLGGDRGWNSTDDPYGHEGSETLTASGSTNHEESKTPAYSDVNNDYSWKNEDLGATTSSYSDNNADSPPHYDDPQYDGQTPPTDYDQVTLGADYGEIPEDAPDEAGNELVATCKQESNYQGDFHDPNESSIELKCFYACAMVKMDVMNENSGQMQLNMQTTINTIEDALGDNTEMIEKYKNAVTACDQEVPRGGDRCDYAFNFINCGIQKVQG